MKFNKKFNSHQGDVQLHSIDSLPSSVKKVNKTFFAKSEKSGHVHALCGDYELYEDQKGSRYILVGEGGAILNHTREAEITPEYWDKIQEKVIADHKPTKLPRGVYHVGIQRRYNPYSNTWEKVLD